MVPRPNREIRENGRDFSGECVARCFIADFISSCFHLFPSFSSSVIFLCFGESFYFYILFRPFCQNGTKEKEEKEPVRSSMF